MLPIEDVSIVVFVPGDKDGEVGVEEDESIEDGERLFLFATSSDDDDDEMTESNDDVESDAIDCTAMAGDSDDAPSPRLSFGWTPIKGVEHVDDGDDIENSGGSFACRLLIECRPINRLLTNSCITSSSSGSSPPPLPPPTSPSHPITSPTSSRISSCRFCNAPRHSHEGAESTIFCSGSAIRDSKHSSAEHDSSTCKVDLASSAWIYT